MTNATDNAYPTLDQNGNERWDTYPGLTKREYFAAMAMQGLVSKSQGWDNVNDIASKSVQVADALIAELNKSTLKQ